MHAVAIAMAVAYGFGFEASGVDGKGVRRAGGPRLAVRARELAAMAIVSVCQQLPQQQRCIASFPSARASAWMTEPGSRSVGTFLPVASREPRRLGSALLAVPAPALFRPGSGDVRDAAASVNYRLPEVDTDTTPRRGCWTSTRETVRVAAPFLHLLLLSDGRAT
jgi:hypothetical protein